MAYLSLVISICRVTVFFELLWAALALTHCAAQRLINWNFGDCGIYAYIEFFYQMKVIIKRLNGCDSVLHIIDRVNTISVCATLALLQTS